MAQPSARGERLPRSRKLLYGAGDVGNAAVNSAIGFFLLPFYTDVLLVGPALAATALLVGKIWDGVFDPVFGYLSDRAHSRLGKRRVFLILGAPPLALSVALLWWAPRGLTGAGLFAWIAIGFALFGTLWTMTNVPYYALTSELTDDYDERASLTAYRMIFAVPAYILGAALTPLLAGLGADRRAGHALVGVTYGLVALAALWIAAAGVHEKRGAVQAPARIPVLAGFRAAFRNRPFVQLMAAFFVANTAFALARTFLFYFLTYALRMEAQIPAIMFTMLACVAAALFPWQRLAERLDKGPAYALGLVIGGGAVAAAFLLPAHPTWLIYLAAVIAGVGFSANWVFPWAMVPDVVEYDRLETGEYRGGIYFGMWGFCTKASEMLAIGATGWVLDLFGYVPNVEQSGRALLGIRLFFGPVPALCFVLTLPLLIWYPVTRRAHAEVKRKLAEREAGAAAARAAAP